jgi:hypothetical protein
MVDKKTVLTDRNIKLRFTKYFKSEMDKFNISIDEELGARITLEFIYDIKRPTGATAKKYSEFKKKYSSEITTVLVTFCRDILKEELDGVVLPERPNTKTKSKQKIEPSSAFGDNIEESILEKSKKTNTATATSNGDSVIFSTEKRVSDYLYSSLSILTTLKLATVSLVNTKDTANISYLVKWEKDVDERTRVLFSNRIKEAIERDITVKIKTIG